MCEYCEKREPLLKRNSRKVKIEEGNHMKMFWKTPNGKWHAEWTPIKFCPMCGRDLMGGE